MSVIFARDAQVGTEYIDAKSKSQARLVVKEKKENKVLTSLNIPGYGWKPFYVQSEHLLRELGKSEVKKQLGKSSTVKAGKVIIKVNKEGKVQRLEKVPEGKSAPRIKLEEFNLRQNYRARLSMRSANECEAAHRESCVCRCGGALHGINHKGFMAAEAEAFDASPNKVVTAQQMLELIKKFSKKTK